MFEDSTMESAGRIHTRRKWTAIGSLILQAAILAVLLLLPEIYPAALPKQAMQRLLIAPATPPLLRRWSRTSRNSAPRSHSWNPSTPSPLQDEFPSTRLSASTIRALQAWRPQPWTQAPVPRYPVESVTF